MVEYIIDNTLYTFKLDGHRTVELEKAQNKSISEIIAENSFHGMVDVIACAMTLDADRLVRQKKTLDLFDHIVESGKNIIEFQNLEYDILVDAGFMNAAFVEKTKAAIQKAEAAMNEKIETMPGMNQ